MTNGSNNVAQEKWRKLTWRAAPPCRVGATVPPSRISTFSVHSPVAPATFTWLGCLRPVLLGPVDKLTPEPVHQPVSTGFPSGLITVASPQVRKGASPRGGARLQACRVAIHGDMSLQHDQALVSAPASRSFRAKTHESNEIASVMWGVLTRVRPAPSTQTIENKRTILRHRPRAPRKTEISPYMRHSATLCDIL